MNKNNGFGETVLVTCGGTTEPIDDVRAITNFSTGRFGHALAKYFALRRMEVTELCPRSTLDRLGEEAMVRYEHFTDAEDLQAKMLNRPAPSIVLHAAAVSDYTPVRTEGKISSDQDELTIRLKRTPKIIKDLRAAYGKTTFIAGFKLLSGVSEETLIAAAMKQLHDHRLNMVIANDLQNLKDGNHPILVCTAEGGVVRFNGQRARVAHDLMDFIHRRAQTHWFHSIQTDLEDDFDHTVFDETLALAHELNLLYDASGNVSARVEGGLLVSPRQVDKSMLTPENAVLTQVDLDTREVQYKGVLKPSIDTGMSAMLYHEYETLDSIIHFHGGWGLMSTETRFPYPCGAVEESSEIIAVQESQPELAVELIHHGFLLGLKSGDRTRLREEWSEIKHRYLVHLEAVGEVRRLNLKELKPIWHGHHIVGVVQANPAGSAVYLGSKARGRGVGAKVVEQLQQRKFKVQTVDDCGVRDYYKSHNFTETWDQARGVYVLTPPSVTV